MENGTADEIIQEIKAKLSEINQFDSYRESSWAFNSLAEKLRDIVHTLSAFDEHKANAEQAVSALNHTIGKEVSYLDDYYKEMKKRNAANVRAQEYYKAVNVAVRQINADMVWLSL